MSKESTQTNARRSLSFGTKSTQMYQPYRPAQHGYPDQSRFQSLPFPSYGLTQNRIPSQSQYTTPEKPIVSIKSETFNVKQNHRAAKKQEECDEDGDKYKYEDEDEDENGDEDEDDYDYIDGVRVVDDDFEPGEDYGYVSESSIKKIYVPLRRKEQKYHSISTQSDSLFSTPEKLGSDQKKNPSNVKLEHKITKSGKKTKTENKTDLIPRELFTLPNDRNTDKLDVKPYNFSTFSNDGKVGSLLNLSVLIALTDGMNSRTMYQKEIPQTFLRLCHDSDGKNESDETIIKKFCIENKITVDVYIVRREGGKNSNWIENQPIKTYYHGENVRFALAFFSDNSHYELIVSKTQFTSELKNFAKDIKNYRYVPPIVSKTDQRKNKKLKLSEETKARKLNSQNDLNNDSNDDLNNDSNDDSNDDFQKFIDRIFPAKKKQPDIWDLLTAKNKIEKEIKIVSDYEKFCIDEKNCAKKINAENEKLFEDVNGSVVLNLNRTKAELFERESNKAIKNIVELKHKLTEYLSIVNEEIELLRDQ